MTKGLANRRFLCVNVDHKVSCAGDFFLRNSLFDIHHSHRRLPFQFVVTALIRGWLVAERSEAPGPGQLGHRCAMPQPPITET